MTRIKINDMMCNHCCDRIASAIAKCDSNAKITCDLHNKTVYVESTCNDTVIIGAIQEAGYTPILIKDAK